MPGWAWFLIGWFVLSAVLAPFAGRLIGRVAERYPEVGDGDE